MRVGVDLHRDVPRAGSYQRIGHRRTPFRSTGGSRRRLRPTELGDPAVGPAARRTRRISFRDTAGPRVSVLGREAPRLRPSIRASDASASASSAVNGAILGPSTPVVTA